MERQNDIPSIWQHWIQRFLAVDTFTGTPQGEGKVKIDYLSFGNAKLNDLLLKLFDKELLQSLQHLHRRLYSHIFDFCRTDGFYRGLFEDKRELSSLTCPRAVIGIGTKNLQ